MRHFKTISQYYNAIGNTAPNHLDFDIRCFEENAASVKTQMEAFRHEFYVIAIRTSGEGELKSGHNTEFPEGITIYFNSPFQLQSWDFNPNWSGYYIIFSQDFLSSSHYFDRLLDDFPFLKIDESAPFVINEEDLPAIVNVYDLIQEEYLSDKEDKFDFIVIHVLYLLNQIKRLLSKYSDSKTINEQIHKADLKLLTRFQELIKESFYADVDLAAEVNSHSPSYYAKILNVHPNHLNAVVKSTTGQTAVNQINNYILQLAKAELLQTDLSAKEIAYRLHFSSPVKFSTFFKRHTGVTPLSYRKNP